ncbi:hypothetical protein VE04_08683 [Pseudogymnoascus sp. 24MN13]|nr:hypothetical protein VE04_08683 [Pseudogymnoascus sp. 24MN13]
MRSFLPALSPAAATLLVPEQSLYFYIEGTNPKCFFERLPKDTLVVGQYKAEEFNLDQNRYVKNDNLNIFISVESSTTTTASSPAAANPAAKITFTSADSGDHRICFTPSHSTGHSGWLGGQSLGGIETDDHGKITDLVQKVKDLNGRLMDIKREQLFQREREAEFRDQSEATNSRVVRWTLGILLALVGITCAWQLSHLRSFFIKQKLT